VYVNGAFDSFFWGLLGRLLLPWTTLMYIAIYPGGIMGFDWILLGLVLFADMATYFGGYRERERVSYGDQIPKAGFWSEMAHGPSSKPRRQGSVIHRGRGVCGQLCRPHVPLLSPVH
jgi:hypothetical protein